VKLNSRVKFPKGRQREFLGCALSFLDIKTTDFAKAIGVHDRTLRDWVREKYNIPFSSLFSICYKINAHLPKYVVILPPYWSTEKASKLGGKRYIELYGTPGTGESRRRGGLRTQEKMRLSPELAQKTGFSVRKNITRPKKSPKLAEFIGIMLGDGGLRNDYQITVSFNMKKDQEYAVHIRQLINDLFGLSSKEYIRKKMGAADIVVTSKNLTEFLEEVGIKKGNKVKNQIDVPGWIFEKRSYQSACLRGLFDTDGCIYQHRYAVGGKKYRYVKMCFSNHSTPLLLSIKNMLANLGFNAVLDSKQQAVYLNNPAAVNKYFLTIGTSNPRYYKRYKIFFSKKTGRTKI
jgi:hypothetical protein